MFKPILTAAMPMALIALPGCSGNSDDGARTLEARGHVRSGAQPGSGSRSIQDSAPPDIPATTKTLLAAAVPFETLTETAFSASREQMNQGIDAARDAVDSVRGAVPMSIFSELNRNMAAIDAADVANRPADIAIASIENYRVLVNAVPGSPVVPVDVSLLDYAGFRFDADAKATPVRWDDMNRVLEFARQRWSSVASKAAGAKMAPRFEVVLSGMEQAVRARNIARARSSAKAELDLVDKLEVAFERGARSAK